MRDLTNAELAILGLIVEAPRHGYEIEQVIEERGMREWTEIGFSSIYYLLNRLEDEGLIAPEKTAGGSPKARKVYHPTATGTIALSDGTRRALALPHAVYPSLLVGLANWPVLEADAARTALLERHAVVESTLKRIIGRRAEQQPLPAFVNALFGYSIGQLEAELAWIEDTTSRLEGGNHEKG